MSCVSNVLRFTTDRSLVALGTNYAAAESEQDLANAALNFDMDAAGRAALHLILTDVQRNFNGQEWGHNGPELIARVLQNMCGTKHVRMGRLNECFLCVHLYKGKDHLEQVVKVHSGSRGIALLLI